MHGTEPRVRIVLVSPGDVARERTAAQAVVDELNRGVAANRLVLWRWETDARPGLHLHGPQGLIDKLMNIADADLVVGVFWKRFGTPTAEADSGTEHELRRAWAAWSERGRPEVFVYFCTRPYSPQTVAETTQWGSVLEFQRDLPEQQLWWTYRKVSEFEALLREHLTSYLLAQSLAPLPAVGAQEHVVQSAESVGAPNQVSQTTDDLQALVAEAVHEILVTDGRAFRIVESWMQPGDYMQWTTGPGGFQVEIADPERNETPPRPLTRDQLATVGRLGFRKAKDSNFVRFFESSEESLSQIVAVITTALAEVFGLTQARQVKVFGGDFDD